MKNNARLEQELPSVPEEKRTGRFRCVMVLAKGGKALQEFAGTVEGRLLEKPKGAEGFGYDPYFVPDEFEKTFAELGSEIKNGMSHRGRALRQVVDYLNGMRATEA